jgi:hypothetical protein
MSDLSIGLKDTPIDDNSDEALGLAEYASALIQFTRTCDTPMTIALQGDWGSGKTSLMNLIRKEVEKDAKTRVVWFNTWQYSQFAMSETLTISMISHFVECVVQKNTARAQSLKQAAERLGWGFFKTTAGAFTGGVAKDVMQNLEAARAGSSTFDSATQIRLLKENLQEAVEEEEAERIVVFIDDLDRLIPIRAVELLEGLKLFMDLPKCVYILACDYQVVIQGLKDKFGSHGSEPKGKSFFDKIIQVPFHMPLTQYQVTTYFQTLLEKIKVEYKPEDVADYVELVNCSVGFNPRSMKRLFNSLLLLGLVADKKKVYEEISPNTKKNELSKILFGILCMQNAYEPVYRYISRQTRLSDELFKDFMDEQKLRESSSYEALRQDLPDPADLSFYRRLALFMEVFYHAIQLASDKSADADESLSDDEIRSLRKIMNFSTVVSTEAAQIEIDYGERHKNRDIAKTMVLELNEKYAEVLSPLKESLKYPGFSCWMAKSREDVAIRIKLYSKALGFGLEMFFDPAVMNWRLMTERKQGSFAARWARENLTDSFPGLTIDDSDCRRLAQLHDEKFKPEDGWETRVDRFRKETGLIVDKFLPAFRRAHDEAKTK